MARDITSRTANTSCPSTDSPSMRYQLARMTTASLAVEREIALPMPSRLFAMMKITGRSQMVARPLRHHRARAHSASDCLAVIAVGGDYVIIGSDHRHHASRDRFLTDVQVAETADLSERVGLGAALLEATLEEH